MALTSLETADFLRSIAVADDEVFAIGKTATDTHQNLAYFLVQDWILVGYWDESEFQYLDRVVSPLGEMGEYAGWRSEGILPEDRLSSLEFAWLWGMLDRADVIQWDDILTKRVRAAGRGRYRRPWMLKAVAAASVPQPSSQSRPVA